MDIIEIKNLRLRSIIGFSAHELDAAQDIVISLRLGCPSRRAGESDNPADAFNYKPLNKAIIELVEGSRFSLVEKLAEEIARLAIIEYGAPFIEVSLDKPGALRRSDSVGIRIARRAADYERNLIFVSLGSNIAPEENLAKAIALLRRYTTVLALSPVYRSPPQGYLGQAPFLNMAVKIYTLRSPIQFKTEVIDRIELELERRRDPNNKNAPRTIDLDISLWNDEMLEYGAKPWVIPDPDILQVAHVAVPLADLSPDFVHPLNCRTLRDIAAALDFEAMQPVELDFRRQK